jgi:phage shock protein PspC (stress-responsive transcriptional regulator)
MKKTVPISIAQTLFYIEEDGFALLENYLKEIKNYFASFADRDEIISDIESRIREQFLEYSTSAGATDRIITKAHIDELIKTMGWPNEFGIDPSEESESKSDENADIKAEQKKQSKKLYRDPSNKVIAGVASGIAAYFAIDPVIVRALFFISIFFGGFGVVIYLVLWFALPQALTPTQQLEMKGERVTIDEVKKMVQEKVAEVDGSAAASGIKKIFSDIFSFIGRVGERFFQGLGKFIGGLFKFISLIAMIALTIAFISLSLHPFTYIGGIAVPEFHSVFSFILIAFVWYVCVVIPCIFFAALGYVLQGKKVFTRRPIAALLLALWIIAMAFGVTLGARIGTNYVRAVQSSDAVRETTISPELPPFEKISIQNGINVSIATGDAQSVTATGSQASIDHTEFTVTNGTLSIKKTDGLPRCFFCTFAPTNVSITTPSLTELTLKNGSRAEVTGDFQTLSVATYNASSVTLDGTANTLTLEQENASRVNAASFTAAIVQVRLENASRAQVNATTTLSGSLSNGSALTQYGMATTNSVATHNGSHVERTSDSQANPEPPSVPEQL